MFGCHSDWLIPPQNKLPVVFSSFILFFLQSLVWFSEVSFLMCRWITDKRVFNVKCNSSSCWQRPKQTGWNRKIILWTSFSQSPSICSHTWRKAVIQKNALFLFMFYSISQVAFYLYNIWNIKFQHYYGHIKLYAQFICLSHCPHKFLRHFLQHLFFKSIYHIDRLFWKLYLMNM